MARRNKRPSSSNEKELLSDMSLEINTPVIVNTGNTQRGVGKPKGTSKSAWGSTFLDRKKFFERGVQKDEEGYLTADEEDPRPRLTVSNVLSRLLTIIIINYINKQLSYIYIYIYIYI